LGDCSLWVVFVGKNYGSSTNHWATFSPGKSCVLIFTRNGLGYILGDFFTSASTSVNLQEIAEENIRPMGEIRPICSPCPVATSANQMYFVGPVAASPDRDAGLAGEVQRHIQVSPNTVSLQILVFKQYRVCQLKYEHIINFIARFFKFSLCVYFLIHSIPNYNYKLQFFSSQCM
jgi:hypothetical protein